MSPPTSPPLPVRRGLVALIASLSAIGPFSVDAYLPAMVAIGDELRANPLAVQQTLTAFMVPFAVMSLWHGSISDSLGRRTVILWSTALFALASVACAFARSIESLLLFRGLQGMTAGAGMIVGRAIVRDLYQGAAAQRAMSHVSMMFAFAPAIAPVIGGWLQAGFGWRSVFVFLVLAAGATWLLCQRLLPETLPVTARQPLRVGSLTRAYGAVLSSAPFVTVSMAFTLIFSGFFIYVAAAPAFMTVHLNVGPTGFLWLFGPATLGIAIGSYLSARAAGRMTTARTLGWAFGLMGAGAAGNLGYHLLQPAGLPWSVLPLFVYTLGMALAFPSLTLMALDLFPARRGLAASCHSFVQTSGAAANALLAPLVWQSPFTLACTQAVFLALGLAALLIYQGVVRPQSAQPQIA